MMRGSAEFNLAEEILRQPGVFAAVVVGSIVIGGLCWLAASATGWSRTPAALAGCGLALALAVTLVRPGFHLSATDLRHPLAACVHDSFALSGSWQLLNFAMLMPFAFFGALAIRRPVTIVALCAVLSAGIEVTQAVTSVGVCQKQDFLNNSLGAALAATAAWGLLTLTGKRRVRHESRVR